MSTLKTVATVLAGVVVLGGGGAYLWSNFSSSDNKENSTTSTTTKTTITTTTESTTQLSESTTSSSTSEETTTKANQPQSVVTTMRQAGVQQQKNAVQSQAGQQSDLPNTAEIPKLTADQPIPITYANIRNANTGWPLKVKGVIEAHLGKPLSNATNKEIQAAVTSIASKNGFEEAVKTPVTP